MTNKLQELTDRLYNEGLSKGKQEGERLLEDARTQAAQIVSDARNEAAAIISEAEKNAAAIKSKADSDVRIACGQCLQALRNDIQNLLTGEISSTGVSESLSNENFLKEIIEAVARNFSCQESRDISLVLPESLRERLLPWVQGELSKALGKGVKANFSKKIAGGFTIGPSDGSWFIDLTEESFKSLIAEYLRPVTKKLLFGE